jgi:deoxycytidine triphosphate deaminase
MSFLLNTRYMILGKKELLKYISEGKIKFNPGLDAFQLQPNSIDLRIGTNFYVTESWQLTEAGRVAVEPDYLTKEINKDYLKLVKLKPGQYFEILPKETVLISSLEKIELDCGDVMAVLHPRSSMVRRGLVLQGGVVDVRYKGHLIIPILNSTNHNLRLYVGERAYQLLFYTLPTELNNDEAQAHGVVSAKYENSTAYNLEARTDSDEEINFIKGGDLENLKTKYPASEKGS